MTIRKTDALRDKLQLLRELPVQDQSTDSVDSIKPRKIWHFRRRGYHGHFQNCSDGPDLHIGGTSHTVPGKCWFLDF